MEKELCIDMVAWGKSVLGWRIGCACCAEGDLEVSFCYSVYRFMGVHK